MRPRGKPEVLAQRRRRAMELLQAGYTPVEAAQMLGVDRRSVRRRHAVYRRQGRIGIEARPTLGRPSALTDRDKQCLESSW